MGRTRWICVPKGVPRILLLRGQAESTH
ncbi:hypothetical protein AKJ16_DCAP09646 [Drosera capensis]